MDKFNILVEGVLSSREQTMADLGPDVRSEIELSFDKPTSALTLDNLVGRIVFFELKNGEKFKGIVQKSRDFMTDTNALRVFTLEKPGVRVIPKKWITKAIVGTKEVELPSVSKGPKEYKVKGSTGNTYTVKTDGFGKWSCTCPAFKWQKGNCKHIEAIKKQ